MSDNRCCKCRARIGKKFTCPKCKHRVCVECKPEPPGGEALVYKPLQLKPG